MHRLLAVLALTASTPALAWEADTVLLCGEVAEPTAGAGWQVGCLPLQAADPLAELVSLVEATAEAGPDLFALPHWTETPTVKTTDGKVVSGPAAGGPLVSSPLWCAPQYGGGSSTAKGISKDVVLRCLDTSGVPLPDDPWSAPKVASALGAVPIGGLKGLESCLYTPAPDDATAAELDALGASALADDVVLACDAKAPTLQRAAAPVRASRVIQRGR